MNFVAREVVCDEFSKRFCAWPNMDWRLRRSTQLTWCKRSWRSLSIRELPRACGRSALPQQKATKTVRWAAANVGPIRVEGDVRLEFVCDGKNCNKEFLDAYVKRPLISVRAIDDEGNIVVFGPQESYIESTGNG